MAATAEFSGLSRSTHEAGPRPLLGARFDAVAVGEVGALVKDVERSGHDEDRHERLEVVDREPDDARRDQE